MPNAIDMPNATHIQTAASRLGRAGGAAGKGSPARKAAAIKAAKVRWGHEVCDESDMQFKCVKCGALNKINVGQILGSRKSPAKTRAARINALKGGRPSQWTVEQRRNAVQLLLHSGLTAVQISTKLGIPPWTLSKWKSKALKEKITPPLPPLPKSRARAQKTSRGAGEPKPIDRQ